MIRVNEENCVGCTACQAICSVGAIKMKSDERGFLYPAINENLCIGCDLCEKVCMCSNEKKYGNTRLKKAEYHIARLNDEKERQSCQSGGVSYGIAKSVLKEGGIVYGCVYENCVAVHSRIISADELNRTCGSKYVQSDLRDVYKEVYIDLIEGKKVLFTGTSCYIEGLYQFLARKKCPLERLYTADIICHGVPSPLILSEYLKYLSKKYRSEVASINMRNRKFAPALGATIVLKNGKELKDLYWSDLFYSNIILRKSCANCKFTMRDKPADLTMSDVIGLDSKYRDILDETDPSSIVITHSDKGRRLLEQADLELISISENEFSQPNLSHPTRLNRQVNKFWKEYRKYGFEFVLKKYTGAGGIKAKIRRRILIQLKKW